MRIVSNISIINASDALLHRVVLARNAKHGRSAINCVFYSLLMHNEWEFLSKAQIKVTGDCRNVLIAANARDYAAFRRIEIGAESKSLRSRAACGFCLIIL